jgi:hypothetical protein
MIKGNGIAALIGLMFFYAVVFGSIAYSAKTDPVGHEPAVASDVGIVGHERAYGAVHGIVIGPHGN